MDALTGTKPAAVHWATAVSPEGVVGWTEDRDRALALDEASAKATLACYAKRPEAGRMNLERVALQLPVEEAKATEAEPATPAKPKPEPRKKKAPVAPPLEG